MPVLQLFRNNSPYTVILLFLFTLLIKMQVLLHPVLPVVQPHHAAYGWVMHALDWILRGSAFGYSFLALLLLFGQAIYLNSIVSRHKLFGKTTYLPAFLYLALSSLSTSFSQFSPVLLVNIFVLGALDVCLQFGQTMQPRRQVFNAGFLLAQGGLLYFPASAYFLFFLFALLLLRPFNPGEWVVALLGYLTPFYFFACLLFLGDQFPLLRRWPETGVALPLQMKYPVYTLTGVTGLMLLLVSGLFVLQAQMGKSSIYVRRSWAVVIALLVTSVVAAVLSSMPLPQSWLLIMPTLSMIASATLYLEKSKRISTFAFFFILAFTIFCQFATHK